MMDLKELPWHSVTEGMHENDYALNAVRPYLPVNPVVLEAGASCGEDTERMKRAWPEATIYAFEPVKELYDRLACLVVPAFKGIWVYNMALTDYNGITDFNIGAGVEMSSLFDDGTETVVIPKDIIEGQGLKSGKMPGYGYTHTVVDCTTVDFWARRREVGSIDFFWLDAEGAELLILKGAAEMLKRVRVVSAELNFKTFRKGGAMFQEVYDYLIEKNFELKRIWGRPDWQATGLFVKRGN